MPSNHFATDHEEYEIQVEGDHVYVWDRSLGPGAELTDVDTIRRLRDELTSLLDRLEDVFVSQR